jgi:hypothetical protein
MLTWGLALMRAERLLPSDRELSRPALVLAQQFVQRWDLYARQLDDGRYICVHELLNVSHLSSHLRGEMTLGTYVLDQESKARFIVLDADDDGGFSGLVNLSRKLAADNVPSYLETSRRGGHLWLFFGQAVSGLQTRAFGQGLMASHKIRGVELFPKQDRLGEGPGSLIRLPFGVHRLAGRRYGFITPDGENLAPTIREQIQVFSALQTVPEAAFEEFRSVSPVEPLRADSGPTEESTGRVSEKIKASVTVLEFVSQYVDLKPTASGALGLCPFHNDHHPSFGVNDEGNFWHCFAGCGGGSVIDFWMEWQRCDFTTAVTELAEMLL